MSRNPEGVAQDDTIDILQNHGYWAQPIEFKNERGCTDLIVFYPGMSMPLWMEIKTPKGRLSPHQQRIHKKLKHHGCKVVTITNATDALREADAWFGRRE